MLKKATVILSGIVLMAALLAVQALAAPTDAPDAADIDSVNNLTGTPDTVTVDNVLVNDIIRVYSAAVGGAPVGVTVADSASATVNVNQLGAGGGNAYVTVTSGNSSESDRIPVPYDAELKTAPPDAGDITVNNFAAGRPDLIVVLNLSPGDIVRVYQNSVSTVALAAAVNPSGGWLFVNQLGVAAGSVYVSVQSSGELESSRTPVSYISETTVGPADGDVAVVNNHYTETGNIQDSGTEDTVTVSGAMADDIITIYKSSIGPETWLPPMTVTAADIDANGDVSLTIDQLGEKAGKIYVTITRVTKAESKRKPVSYLAEPVADTPVLTNITVTNNYIIGDTVRVTSLLAGDRVNVYATPVGLATIGSNTVGPAVNEVTVPINPGLLATAGGKIYVTVTSATANESVRLAVPYGAEDVTDGVSLAQVTITNNYSISDIVNIKGLSAGDLVKVYATPAGATLIGSDTAAVDQVTITINPGTLLTKGGNVYITVTAATANESKRTAAPYKSEPIATAPVAADIDIINNYSASDTVEIPDRTAGDVVKVYASPTGATLIGSATESGGTATVSIDVGVLSATGGKIYVTVTSLIANESTRVMVPYLKEATTNPPLIDDITVTNNYLIQDTIDVTGLTAGDIVKIYSSLTGTAIIDSATATGTSHTFTLDPSKQLSAAGGKIYVSVKINTANESPRTTITYSSEKSTAPIASNVAVTNNFYAEDAGGTQIPASEDTVRVSGVKLGDIITIYKASGGAATWVNPVTVAAGNLSGGSVTIPVSQLGTKAGKLFVTVTELNRSESIRTGVTFLSEPTTTAPLAASIIIINNDAAEDTVTINNLTAGQVVTIYTAATGTAMLDTAAATGVSKTFTLDDNILASGGGKLFITVRDTDKLESLRTAQVYTSETTATPKASNILVVNYAGTAYDTITITGLTPGDIVRIYTLPTGGTAQTTATVAVKGTTFTLDANLADIAGTIYVSVTNDGKAESKRVAVNYDAA